MRLLRRLCSHVSQSNSAQLALQSIHKMLTGEGTGSLGGLSFAPHRFLSHATPCKLLVQSFPDLIQYVIDNSNASNWARDMMNEVQELKCYLVFAGDADILQILKTANLRTQRTTLRVLEIEDILAVAKRELTHYMADGGPWKAALQSLQRQPEVFAGATLIETACKRVQIQKQGGNLVGKVALNNDVQVVFFKLTRDTLTDATSILKRHCEIILAELEASLVIKVCFKK